MKLLRIKITDPKGFRSLQAGFEYHFRSEWDLQEEKGFAPFVCAGPNGSGKSNLLEALAAIFYHMECTHLQNLPDSFLFEEQLNPNGFRSEKGIPDGFEIEFLIPPFGALRGSGPSGEVHLRIVKELNEVPIWFWLNHPELPSAQKLETTRQLAREILPAYILGYSSGDNEILSLPFFKMRFIQFDEYWQALKQQLPFPGQPESRLVYLDSGFSQAILLCNLLFLENDDLQLFSQDIGIEDLKEFRIIIRQSIELKEDQIHSFGRQDENKRESIDDIVKNHPALTIIEDEKGKLYYQANISCLLGGGDDSDKFIPRLKRCATCSFLDDATDTLYLDYYVNDTTRQAFRDNFSNSPLELFQAFQVLLTLNLFSVSDILKADLYQSDSHYASETVPTLASDERIMRFKFVKFMKTGVEEPVMLKSLSDGEHQLLHTLGLCLLFRNTNSLFLLDEPETHFNPDWRANLVTRLYESFKGADDHDMFVTTHTPFLISDSKPEKVLVFRKEDGVVSVRHPEYNTLGASINKITMDTFGKRETIGGHAQAKLEKFRQRFENDEDKEQLITEINQQLGDSVEKMLLIKIILDSMEGQG